MKHYTDNKPNYLLTEKECRSLNVALTKTEQPVATFSSFYRNYEQFPLFDKKTELHAIPIVPMHQKPFGYVAKLEALSLQITIDLNEKAASMYWDDRGRGFVGLYDKSDNPEFIKHYEKNKVLYEVLAEGKLGVYRQKNKPKHLLTTNQMRFYYFDSSKQPAGIHLSNSDRYRFLYDMTDEMNKPHFFGYEAIPLGFFTQQDLNEMALPFDEKEPPDAYLTFTSTNKRVIPLYDYRSHPKIRLKVVTETLI